MTLFLLRIKCAYTFKNALLLIKLNKIYEKFPSLSSRKHLRTKVTPDFHLTYRRRVRSCLHVCNVKIDVIHDVFN